MRIVDWNIEHMNSWFVPGTDPNSPSLRRSYKPARGSSYHGGEIADVPALAQRAADVLKELDPDLVCIQEGASEDEVSLFLDEHLALKGSARWKVIGGDGAPQQLVVAARLDRGVVTAMAEADDSQLDTQLASEYEADTDGDAVLETDTTFARVPQVVDIVAYGRQIRVVNCHLKSKYVRDGKGMSKGSQARRREYLRAALVVRRRISSEAFRLRQYLNDVFKHDPNQLLVLAGDLNDGPGFDWFERRFLTHSLIDVIFGTVLRPESRLVHPLIRHGGSMPVTAYFDDFIENIKNKALMLDHVGLSPTLANWRISEARVAHAEFNKQEKPRAANERERLPSDHRPILLEIKPPANGGHSA